MIHVILSPIGLLLYWPVAVFIVHAKTQHSFDPPTEAIVCNTLHPRPKPCGLWDICQILLDQRMTITQTVVHIPPTAALEVSWPLKLKNTGGLGVTFCLHVTAVFSTRVCCSLTCLCMHVNSQLHDQYACWISFRLRYKYNNQCEFTIQYTCL